MKALKKGKRIKNYVNRIMAVFLVCILMNVSVFGVNALAENVNKIVKSETELKKLVEKYGTIAAWEYADYDGNGEKEAFAILAHKVLYNTRPVDAVYFINSEGKITVLNDSLKGNFRENPEWSKGHYRECNDKGFFYADIAAGYGWCTILYGVKNGMPYELELSQRIQGFYIDEDVFYTTFTGFNSYIYHAFPKVELLYDDNTQQFEKGKWLGTKAMEGETEIFSELEDSGESQAAKTAYQKVSESWKKEYIKFIVKNHVQDESFKNQIETYKLLDIDGDSVPELYIMAGVMSRGSLLCSFYRDEVVTQNIWEGGLTYVEGKNLFKDAGGRMDGYWDVVYSIQDGKFIVMHDGEFGSPNNSNSNISYEYYANGKQVSTEEEYLKSLASVYDEQQAKDPCEGTVYNHLRGCSVGNGVYDFLGILEKIVNYETVLDTSVQESQFEYKIMGNDHIQITKYTGKDSYVVIPNQIIGRTVQTIADYAFEGCDSVQTIAAAYGFPSNYDFAYCNGDAFTGCQNLKEFVSLSDSNWEPVYRGILYSKDYKTENPVLVRCPEGNELKDVAIKAETISFRNSGFRNCKSMQTISIPKSLEEIGDNCFNGCSGLTDVYYAGTEADWKKIKIGSGNKELLAANMHYGEQKNADVQLTLYSSEKSLQLGVGESLELVCGRQIDGKSDFEWNEMPSVISSNNSVISISDIQRNSFIGYKFNVTAKSVGNAMVTVTDKQSGVSVSVELSVVENKNEPYTFHISEVNPFYPNSSFDEKILTNFYAINGIYVNDFNYDINDDDSYKISFDVYNSSYMYGAVDVFDKNGKWIQSEKIDKYTNISSLYDTGEEIWYMIQDVIKSWDEKNFVGMTYEASTYSRKTHIDIEVPQGGYFTISNNYAESPGVMIYNGVDIILLGFDACKDIFSASNKDEEINLIMEKTVDKCIQQCMVEFDEATEKYFVKKTIKFAAKEGMGSIAESVSTQVNGLLDDWDVNFKGIVSGVTGVGEDVFVEAMGPFGAALKAIFLSNKYTDYLTQVNDIYKSLDAPYICISTAETAKIHGVTVSSTDQSSFDGATLKVFRATDYTGIMTSLKSQFNVKTDTCEIFDISFVKNNDEVNINKEVIVNLPIPSNIDKDKCMVYQQQEDNSWKEISTTINGDYLEIVTTRLGLYAITQLSDIVAGLGDANGDGEIDLTDVQLVLQRYLEIIDEQQAPNESCDVDGSGDVDLSDVQLILQKYLDIIDEFPVVNKQPSASSVSSEPPATDVPSAKPSISGEQPKVSEIPKVSTEPEADEIPEVSTVPEVSKIPQISTVPKISEEPKNNTQSPTPVVTPTPAVFQEPKESEHSSDMPAETVEDKLTLNYSDVTLYANDHGSLSLFGAGNSSTIVVGTGEKEEPAINITYPIASVPELQLEAYLNGEKIDPSQIDWSCEDNGLGLFIENGNVKVQSEAGIIAFSGEPIKKEQVIKASLKKNPSISATVTVKYIYDAQIKFSIEDAEIATVNEDGVLYGKKAGDTILTMQSGQTGKSVACPVSVRKAGDLKAELVYKKDGQYYTLDCYGGPDYTTISHQYDLYLKVPIDNEIVVGSKLELSIGRNSFRRRTVSWKDNYTSTSSYSYYPISSILKNDSGNTRIYYRIILANGQILHSIDREVGDAFHLNFVSVNEPEDDPGL